MRTGTCRTCKRSLQQDLCSIEAYATYVQLVKYAQATGTHVYAQYLMKKAFIADLRSVHCSPIPLGRLRTVIDEGYEVFLEKLKIMSAVPVHGKLPAMIELRRLMQTSLTLDAQLLKNVSEYYAYGLVKAKTRFHLCKAMLPENILVLDSDENHIDLSKLKGDSLKAAILEVYKQKLEKCLSYIKAGSAKIDDLTTVIARIKLERGYSEVLAKSQDLPKLFRHTSSIRAFAKMAKVELS